MSAPAFFADYESDGPKARLHPLAGGGVGGAQGRRRGCRLSRRGTSADRLHLGYDEERTLTALVDEWDRYMTGSTR